MEKICSKCSMAKPLTEFYVRDQATGRLHAQCKLCYQLHRRTYYTEHYQKYQEAYRQRAKLHREKLKSEFRANMLAYLSDKSCVRCGENDIRVLELDHIEPEKKSFTVSQAVKLGHSWSDVVKELQKCQVLCANCHKRRTAEQFNWYKA